MLTKSFIASGPPLNFKSSRFRSTKAAVDGSLMDASTSFSSHASIPVGNRPPISFVMARSGYNMAAHIYGSSTIVAPLKGAGNIVGSSTGLGSVDVNGFMTMERTVTIEGLGDIVITPKGYGNLSITIDIGSRPSAFDITQAVLNALATQYNIAGTIGNKINSAASAGDPWSTVIPGSYEPGSAGQLLGNLGEGSDPQTIADKVWDTAVSSHATPGTFGEYIQKKLLSVAKFIGLK